MQWLEVIRLRAGRPCEGQVLQVLEPLLEEARRQSGHARVYMHHEILGDLAVHLLWHSAEAPCTSVVGRLIAERMRAFGLVDYAVWRQAASTDIAD